MSGFSITVFLPNGEPNGLRIVSRSNWTGAALMTRRDRLEGDLRRPEFSRSGVYVLLGPGDSGPASRRIYVGEGTTVSSRIRDHVANKEFWTELVLFTKTDDSLNKAHIGYLEARLVDLASEAERVELDNGQTPGLPSTTEAETADLESFLMDMLVIFRLLGINGFEAVEELQGEHGGGAETYLFDAAGTQGRGTPTSTGFLVKEGSRGRLEETGSISSGYAALRQELIEDGTVTVVDGRPSS